MDRFTWGIVAGALLLIAVAIGSVVLLERRAAPPDLSRPEGVALAWEDAVANGRGERAWDLLASSAQSQVGRDEFIRRVNARYGAQDGRLTVESAEVEGTTAIVELNRSFPGRGGLFDGGATYANRLSVRLERERGEWRITAPPELFLISKGPP